MSNFICDKCGLGILDGGFDVGYTTGCEHYPLSHNPEYGIAWRKRSNSLPDFREHGFQTGKLVQVTMSDGLQRRVIYQGYGVFGDGAGLYGVTHWRPN